MGLQRMLVMFVCRACGHVWTAEGQGRGDRVAFWPIREPGGADDPTYCPECHSGDSGMRMVEAAPAKAE